MVRSNRRNIISGIKLTLMLVVLTLSTTILATYAATPPPPAPLPNPPTLQEEVIVDEQSNGTQVTLDRNQMLTVNLASNPSTGYQWMVERTEETGQLGDQPVLRQIREPLFETPKDTIYRPGETPGTVVTQTLQFQPVSTGETTLKLVYRRPWENQPLAGSQTFTLNVNSTGSYTTIPLPLELPTTAEHPPLLGDQNLLGLPDKFNWCDNNGCTPIRDQGACGSCWAFATVGIFENAIKIKSGIERDLSEQYLVSCNTNGWSCNGGWDSHEYHVDKQGKNQTLPGAIYESDFSYQAADVACPSSPLTSNEKAELWGYVGGERHTQPSVAAIKQAIYDHGPIFVAVCASNWNYQGGVFENSCDSINHAVILTGWDDSQGTNGVWYLRNSWGTGWGEQGYMRIGYATSHVGYGASYIVFEAEGELVAPTNLTATSEETTITLQWQDNNTTETGFTIQRSTGGNWQQITTVGANTTSFNDTGLQPNTHYYYRVHTYNDSTQSAYSNVAEATTDSNINAPTDLTATADVTTIALQWKDNSTNETGFEVEQWDGQNWQTIHTTNPNVTTYTDSNLQPLTTYYYRVRAVQDSATSAYSNIVSATTGSDQETQTAPWTDTVENGVQGWNATGLWHQIEDGTNDYANSHSPSHSWWYGQNSTGTYDTGSVNSGSLTSPPINIPDTLQSPFLQFWSWYETETGTKFDQRHIMVSVDGAEFQNIQQLSGDPSNEWYLHTINLDDYKGSTIQIRFFFDTVDTLYNAFRGWYIDDIGILQGGQPQITSISPTTGPHSGGTNITITGQNFQSGATVIMDDLACTDVTFIDATQIQCTTPAHPVGPANITVTNPDAQSGTLASGFTYTCDSPCVYIEATGGNTGNTVSIPIYAQDIQGLLSVDVTISFDTTVLESLAPEKGSLTTEWTMAHNIEDNQITLAMANPGDAVDGSGTIAILQFTVVGANGTKSTLHFAETSLNGGNMTVNAADGSFTVGNIVDTSLTGNITYWGKGNPAIPNVALTLDGPQTHNTTSADDGQFSFNSLPQGQYTLTPSKTDTESVNGISAFDCSLVLQHSVGDKTLDGFAAQAADVDQSGTINALDATYILQKSVDKIDVPFPGTEDIWLFDPPSKTFDSLSGNQTQNFTAILIGDPSGNWNETEQLATGTDTLSLSIPSITSEPGQSIDVPINITFSEAISQTSFDLILTYDSTVVSVVNVQKGSIIENWSLNFNADTAGEIKIGLSGTEPINENGALVTVTFRASDTQGSTTPLELNTASTDETPIESKQHGLIRISGDSTVFLPLVLR